MEPNDFAWALRQLKTGKRVTRSGWNGNRLFPEPMFLALQVPDANSKMKRPYIYITPGPDFVVPWVASQADLLGEDWQTL